MLELRSKQPNHAEPHLSEARKHVLLRTTYPNLLDAVFGFADDLLTGFAINLACLGFQLTLAAPMHIR